MWRRLGSLALVLVVQLGIVAAVPARQVRARISGRTITLRTVPVDPYDVLSGYHVRLRYRATQDVEHGGIGDHGEEHWLVLTRADPAWRPVRVAPLRPTALGPDEVAIRVRDRDPRQTALLHECEIPSAGQFFIPEARRSEVDRKLREHGGALVDLRVAPSGDVALVRLRVGDLVLDN